MDRRPAVGSDTRLIFLLLPQVHALDLSGPVQVFYEANGFGARYDLTFCASDREVQSAQGLWLGRLEKLPEVSPRDWILVPGIESAALKDLSAVPVAWLRQAAATGARLASICSGTFVLGHAGLLDGRRCTTHWKLTEELRRRHPAARVLQNRLFVRDGNLTTSAGVASGIDMALSMVEEDHGPLVTARVARELVVYLRRDGDDRQKSVYLDYRTHLHPGVHRVQDWIVAHPDEAPTLYELSRIAGMSERNLTRSFRDATGVTLKAFQHELKLEIAGNLLCSPEMSLDAVASRCGFKGPRQLRRLWKKTFGMSPSTWKSRREGRLSA